MHRYHQGDSNMLDGVRVVDLSTDVAAGYAAKLFATYGADVIKVEAPEGDPTRRLSPSADSDPNAGILFAYVNSGKRSAVLDIDDESQRASLMQLLATADVIFDSSTPGTLVQRGVNLTAVATEHPALIVCSITPFGQDGPRAHWHATALTAFAAGGEMALCGDETKPPLKTAGHQAYFQSGLHGFAAASTALFASRESGIGELLDISIQEVQASTLEGAGPAAMVRGSDSERTGNSLSAMWRIYPCADGWVGLASLPRQQRAVFECIGHPELVVDSRAFVTDTETDALRTALITEWTTRHTAKEIYEAAGHHRAPFSLILEPPELINWQPLRENNFWQEIKHPVLERYVTPSGPIMIDGNRGNDRRAPLLGEHTSEVLKEITKSEVRSQVKMSPSSAAEIRGLLDGVRVLDLSAVWAGPYATRFLADHGAEVIKIEGPQSPDVIRFLGAYGSDPLIYNKSAYFNEYNRNKKSLTLDFKNSKGIEIFKQLVRDADVVIENWSSGVASRLGVGYDDLRKINPDIVFVSMPGFGHDGIEAQRIGYGPTIEQMGGLVALQGYEGESPHKSGISYGDPIAGVTAAAAVALGLLRRRQTGVGCYAVVPQRDIIIGLIGEYLIADSIRQPLPKRIGNRDSLFAPHGVYRARDDSGRDQKDWSGDVIRHFNENWVAIAVDSDETWEALKSVVGDPRLDRAEYETMAGRKAAEAEIDAVLADWLRDREQTDAAEQLQEAGISASPVLTPLMLTRDEHLQSRNFYLKYNHKDAGEHITSRPPWRLSRRTVTDIRPAPRFGEHNQEILSSLADMDDELIEKLYAEGIVSDVPLQP